MIVDEMDIRTICQWRATCQETYRQACSSLRGCLTKRVRAFVPQPHAFVDLVTRHGAVFGGELALSFVLRHEIYRPSHLEVYASNYQYHRLCGAILNDPELLPFIARHTVVTNTVSHTLRRLVAETLIVHLTNGKDVYVHQSYTCSPSAPITHSFCTALSNFVTAYSFGCSHPELTLTGRSLLADHALSFMADQDWQSLDRLLSYGFYLAISPTAWPEYRREMDGDILRSPEECWRERHVCPNQGRFFGDFGSLVRFIDPLGDDEDRCMKNNLPPFGSMVVWRLSSTFECEHGCKYLDEVLEHGVTSIPVLFWKEPFTCIRECASDRCIRVSPYYRRFGRPRCLSL